MRFRTAEDEKRYNALRIEIWQRLSTHLPPLVMNEVVRNFGKIEGLLYGEGIRQGMAVATCCYDPKDTWAPELVDAPAIVAHAAFYGDADTPLSRVEETNLKAFYGAEPVPTAETAPWLDATPLEFPPHTLYEAERLYGPELEPSARKPTRSGPEARKPMRTGSLWEPSEHRGVPGLDKVEMTPPTAEEIIELRAAEIDQPHEAPPEREEDDEDPEPEQDEDPATVDHLHSRDASPAFLDRVRDEIQHAMAGGWMPTSWFELIMHLHTKLGVDAFALDLQLSGDLGRAILAQVGLTSIGPPSMVTSDASGQIRFADSLEDLQRTRAT